MCDLIFADDEATVIERAATMPRQMRRVQIARANIHRVYAGKVILLAAEDPLERAMLQTADFFAREHAIEGLAFFTLLSAIKKELGDHNE